LTAQPPRAVSFTHSSALTISDNSKEVIDIDDDDVDYSYFGSSPNPDPGDYSPGDIIKQFVNLFVRSHKCWLLCFAVIIVTSRQRESHLLDRCGHVTEAIPK
jgi:hypothetical protein